MIVNPYRPYPGNKACTVRLSWGVRGFTLIELTLVLLVVTILLGYTSVMYPKQQELKQYSSADEEMDSIVKYLIRFGQVNGRLPCPDTGATNLTDIDGYEDLDGSGDCKSIYAYLPGKSLGIKGSYDNEGRLLDPWERPYRYAVSDGTSVTAPAPRNDEDNFTNRENIREQGIATMRGDIYICDNGTLLGTERNCAAVVGSNEIISRVAAAVISTGKDRGDSSSKFQAENLDNFDASTSTDRVFVYARRSEKSGSEYDDLIKWLPTSLFLSKLVEAGRLP